MKKWKCPDCNSELKFKYDKDENLVLKICPYCFNKMEVEDYGISK